ncbi:matrilin-2-like [Dunckerocampus dactyliophorus]|uniref:matrilin-2-like n=1 Tax=Dunckerocampus dactyliophorus TaxID=161453 RepID=UPI002406468E|nr:matrilin-2-like [Dunckerocampus dactyliophorus]
MRSLVLAVLWLLCCNAARLDRRRLRPFITKTQNVTHVEDKGAECKSSPVDFVFVIDSSRSIRPDDYEKVKTFINKLLQFLEISPDATRVGLLQYGSVVQNEFSLNTYTTKAEVQQAVRNMEHLATGTMTGLAIQYTMETAFTEHEGARPAHLRIPRIAMVVTDGRPQDSVDEIAARARQAGIQIYAIGVGRVDMSTLKVMGSEPYSEHVHLVANFSQMETLLSVFQSKLCRGTALCDLVDHQCQHNCVSSPASYWCKCRKGFTLHLDGKTCEEVDLCDLVDHGCEHNCVSIPESYVCRCEGGYVLNSDGKTCSKADPCEDLQQDCEQEFMSTGDSCVCTCRKGYRLRPDGKTCHKIDHCAEEEHGCEQEFMNTGGSCVCGCRKGYTLRPDGKTCKKIDHCADGKHGCEQEFISTEDSCVCKCRGGFTLRPDGKTCQSVDACQRVDHGCEHLCVSTTDSYTCRCLEGFNLADDEKSCKKPECGEGVMDLVFVIDGSKSLGSDNFELVKQFVNAIVDSLDISETGTHVGLVQYSTKVRTEFTLGQYSTAQAVKQAVTGMRYMGKGSMTGSALRHMFELSFSAKEGARTNIPRVCIVFTDGRSHNDVSEWASKAKNSGITIYALGVGKAVEQELREIASEPSDKHVYYTDNLGKMEEVTKKLKARICNDKAADENTCQCEDLIMFQNQVNEKLRILTQNVEVMSTRLQLLENQLVQK